MTVIRTGQVSRRELLRGVGGAAALVPLLEMDGAFAAGAAPRRMIVVQTTNGIVTNGMLGERFWPAVTDERAFELDGEIVAPLAPHKKDLLLLGGVEMTVSLREKVKLGGSIGHRNLPHLLTGAPAAQGRNSIGDLDAVGNAISVDQHVANVIAPRDRVPFRSFNLGVLTNADGPAGDNGGYISFNGPAIGQNPARPDGNAPQTNPGRVYESVFTSGVAGAGASALDLERLARLRRRRKSALDFALADLGRLRQRLGTDDRKRLDWHADGIRQLESELEGDARAGANAGCTTPPVPGVDHRLPENFPKLLELQLRLTVTAMACDLVRVATIMVCNAANVNIRFTWVTNETDDHHGYSHGHHYQAKTAAERWMFGQMAALLDSMKAIPEGSGTMLENSVVWWANNMADGDSHTVRGMPWVLAGSCGGYFKTGRYLRYGDWGQASPTTGKTMVPHNGLLVGLANAMGVPTPTFGDPQYGGELPGLRG